MKNIAACLIVLCCTGWSSNALAQNRVGPVVLDKTFSTNGKSEVDFAGAHDEVTCYVAYKTSPIIVAGLCNNATADSIRFGVLRYSPNGVLDATFGSDGKAELGWGAVDYPYSLDLLPTGAILAAGISGQFPFGTGGDMTPALFRLKANGSPDSTFGTNGRVTLPLAPLTSGAFYSLDTILSRDGSDMVGRILAIGDYHSADPGGQSGFLIARFDSTGRLDPDFGNGGVTRLPTPWIHQAHGYVMQNQTILTVTLSDTGRSPEILLGKVTSNGVPDSSFGINGLLNTHIALLGHFPPASLLSAVPNDSTLLVMVPFPFQTAVPPFALIRFKLNGTLDSSYGVDGIASSLVTSDIIPFGLNLSNDRSALICGSTTTGIQHSVVTKFFSSGRIDSSFGTAGVANVDPDSGLKMNFLIGFVPASLGAMQQRFIGIGNTFTSSSNSDFLVSRYIPTSLLSVGDAEVSTQIIQMYPNPASSFMHMETLDNSIQRLDVTDALGRTVRSIVNPKGAKSGSYSLDVSDITNGIYFCIVQTSTGRSSQRIVVAH